MEQEYRQETLKKYEDGKPIELERSTFISKFLKPIAYSLGATLIILLPLNAGSFFVTYEALSAGLNKEHIEREMRYGTWSKDKFIETKLLQFSKPGRDLAYLLHEGKN